jgi:hypothetical protein
LIQVVEQARGGIRLGRSNEVNVEIQGRTADDAATLAALGRWAPGFLQLQDPSGQMGALAAAIENLSVRAEGRTAVASFSVPDAALEKSQVRRLIE